MQGGDIHPVTIPDPVILFLSVAECFDPHPTDLAIAINPMFEIKIIVFLKSQLNGRNNRTAFFR